MVLQWSSLSILVVPVMFYLSTSSDRNAKLTAAYNQDSLTWVNDSLPIFGEPKLPPDLVPRLEEKCLPFKSCATPVSLPRDWQPHLEWLYEFWPPPPSLQKIEIQWNWIGQGQHRILFSPACLLSPSVQIPFPVTDKWHFQEKERPSNVFSAPTESLVLGSIHRKTPGCKKVIRRVV